MKNIFGNITKKNKNKTKKIEEPVYMPNEADVDASAVVETDVTVEEDSAIETEADSAVETEADTAVEANAVVETAEGADIASEALQEELSASAEPDEAESEPAQENLQPVESIEIEPQPEAVDQESEAISQQSEETGTEAAETETPSVSEAPESEGAAAAVKVQTDNKKKPKEKKVKFPKPPKEKKLKQSKRSKTEKTAGRKKGSRKLLLIILAAVVALGAAGFFVVTKFILNGDSHAEKKNGSTTTEESKGAHGEEGKKEKKEAEPQIDKITVTAGGIDLGALEGHLASPYIKILRTNNYTIKYNTTTVYNGQSYVLETIYAVYGSNVAMKSGDRSTVVLNQNVYIMDHTNKTMISWRATETENLKSIDTSDMVFVTSTESGGQTCEEYSTASAHIIFCFSDQTLTRVKTIINKQDVDMDILEFKEGVPMDLFEVPGDYQNSNITDTIEGQRP